MDFDRLTLNETRMVAKLVETLGVPATLDGLTECINVLDATAAMYRKEYAAIRQKAE